MDDIGDQIKELCVLRRKAIRCIIYLLFVSMCLWYVFLYGSFFEIICAFILFIVMDLFLADEMKCLSKKVRELEFKDPN